MGFLNKYGGIWGNLPVTMGKILFVAPSASYVVEGRSYNASDDNDGLSPERAVRTVSRAVALAVAGDTILLMPGAHTISASLALNKANLSIIGLPYYPGAPNQFVRPSASLTISATDQIANVTAANVEIANVRLIPITTQAAIDFSAAGDNLWVHDCSFDMATPAVNTGTIGIDAIGAASNVLIERCYFECDGAQGPAIDMTATLDSVVKDCIFQLSTGTWAAVLTTGAATDRLLIENCKWLDGAGTMTAGVDGTGATIANGVAITNCRFGVTVTVPVDNFDAAEAQLSENYDFGVGAADGGSLVTAIT